MKKVVKKIQTGFYTYFLLIFILFFSLFRGILSHVRCTRGWLGYGAADSGPSPSHPSARRAFSNGGYYYYFFSFLLRRSLIQNISLLNRLSYRGRCSPPCVCGAKTREKERVNQGRYTTTCAARSNLFVISTALGCPITVKGVSWIYTSLSANYLSRCLPDYES